MSGPSSIRTTWKTGTAGPIRINPTHVSRRPTMLTAFSPMRPEELELREQINNFMTDEEKKEYDKWLKIIEYKFSKFFRYCVFYNLVFFVTKIHFI